MSSRSDRSDCTAHLGSAVASGAVVSALALLLGLNLSLTLGLRLPTMTMTR